MRKNSHLHIILESKVLAYLKSEAKKRSISVSELCRLKLIENLQIDRIESILEKILEKNEK
jgi:hypothetical protein